ncbi:nucleotidyltransferase family protein [Desulfovibrionales bacterium]
MRVRGVILAAGMGTRMGQTKQLLPLHGKPLVQHVLDAARSSVLTHLTLILGHAHEIILPALDTTGVAVLINPQYASGQSTSVHLGLAHGPDADGVMFLLGDQPCVTPLLIDTLVHVFCTEQPWAVVPMYQQQPGNPVILGRALMREASCVDGDTGARPLLQRHAAHVRHFAVENPLLLRDVDTLEDYMELVAAVPPVDCSGC